MCAVHWRLNHPSLLSACLCSSSHTDRMHSRFHRLPGWPYDLCLGNDILQIPHRLYFKGLNFVCVMSVLAACRSAHVYICAVLVGARRGRWISGPGVTDGCKPTCGCRKLISGPLPERHVTLASPAPRVAFCDIYSHSSGIWKKSVLCERRCRGTERLGDTRLGIREHVGVPALGILTTGINWAGTRYYRQQKHSLHWLMRSQKSPLSRSTSIQTPMGPERNLGLLFRILTVSCVPFLCESPVPRLRALLQMKQILP